MSAEFPRSSGRGVGAVSGNRAATFLAGRRFVLQVSTYKSKEKRWDIGFAVSEGGKVAQIFLGDCVREMKNLQENSIDLTVTSPPYDNLRTYKGYSFDFENTAKELYRVTKTGGVVVWVVGDSTRDGSESGTSFRQALFLGIIYLTIYRRADATI